MVSPLSLVCGIFLPLQTIPGSQSDSQRAYLRSTYAASKLFKVTKSHVAADLMDISLTEGMLVGVVKELDPMGNKERWFLDDGCEWRKIWPAASSKNDL